MIHVFISIFLGLVTATVVISHQVDQASDLFRDFKAFWDLTGLALKNPQFAYEPAFRTPVGPFAYPPPTLLVLAPFAKLPFHIAYLVWVCVPLALYIVLAARLLRQLKWLGILLLIWAPPVWTVILLGQTTLLMAVLFLGGLFLMPERKLLAGAMFGIAATIKPQTVMLLPLALLAIQEWRVITFSAAATTILSIIATVAFGFGIWTDWLAALPRVLADPVMGQNQLSLWFLSSRSVAVLIILTLVACTIVWITFRATERVDYRLVAAVGGAWLISPYVPVYELAIAIIAFILQEVRKAQLPLIRWRSYFSAVALFAPISSVVLAHLALVLNTVIVLRRDADGAASPPS